ncbi:cytosolic carboxypeptidase 4 [Lampris incognitus]|uniref:cytosolic carboxypeptidase 4 n=1 Tax=Lampris incognitus TaxID=2546036 RepID=UPI0024B4F106|nr:cytosolic carboxypeptidase 4 [Lampris incognitus]
MFGYGRSNFTWNGTLRELETSCPSFCGERVRPIMTATPISSGLEVLLTSLQNVCDIESTLHILNVLDELLSAGSDRRIYYMISKGGSEALLTALINNARCFSPNYAVLVPLLHLLAKVGLRDRRIGLKAEDAGAVLLVLTLLKQNSHHARRAAACLWVIQVFCSSVSTANLIGENHGLDVVYRLNSSFTTRHLNTIKAAIDALTALLSTKANVHVAVCKGYVAGLLRLYEDWHSKDAEHAAVAIRTALLRCLHQATNCSAARQALVSQGGISLLYQTTQSCLLTKGLESLVELSVQLMRKCLTETSLPLMSDQSVYSFPLPGRPDGCPHVDVGTDDSYEEDSDEEESEENQEADSKDKDYDDDLETDLNKLRSRPEPDRPKELLAQYSRLCPELTHDFQELDSGSEPEESLSSSSSDEESWLLNGSPCCRSRRDRRKSDTSSPERRPRCGSDTSISSPECLLGKLNASGERTPVVPHFEPCDFHSQSRVLSSSPMFWMKGRTAREYATSGEKEEGQDEEEEEKGEEAHHRTMVDRLLERHGTYVPHHDPKLYRAASALTKSIPGFSILAFPDFWGHLPPPGHEPMAPRKPKVQRQKVFEDVQRFLNPDDLINQVVFDLEETSPQCVSDRPDSLRFFSKFESGNLRKAIQVRRYEYDLILNADANCSQHTQWFYFEVSNMMANIPYRFNVINCEKTNSQFNYGMQPVLYSVREALDGRPHWVRTGSEICYFRNNFCPAQDRKGETFYTLTFTVTFKHNEDVCYLAYHYPYTYSALQSHLEALQRSVDPAKVFFQQQTLCDSLAGNPCPLVTITACPSSRGWRDIHQLRNRPYIVLTARVHPGESNASWVMKGTLEFLCSSEPVAQSLREAFVFKIIPMLNPDGVINGMHRCALNGKDLNRQWCKPDPVLSPTVYHTKGFLYYLNSIGRTPLVFCDYHGHSRKKNVFLYGCSVKETLWQSGSAVDTVGVKEDPGYRTIPKTLDRIAPAFSFNSCNYLVEKSRSATARVVVWREMGVLRCYTMESTYNGCDQGIYKGLQTGTRELEEMGVKFCHSLLSLRRDITALYSKKLINHIDLDHNVLDHNSYNCFEDDEPPCVEEIEYSTNIRLRLNAPELDSDIDGSTSSAEEEEEQHEEGHTGGNHDRSSNSESRQSSLKSRLFPYLIEQGSIEKLNMKRTTCNGVTVANGPHLT